MTPEQEAHEGLADSLTGLVRDVVMLHRPDEYGGCLGCGPGDRVWPCRTIRLIAEEMGL